MTASEILQKGNNPTTPVTMEGTMDFYRKALTGGKSAGATTPGDMRVEQRLKEAGVSTLPDAPAPAPNPNASNYVDPATNIRFANGGPIKGKPMIKHPNIHQDAHTAPPPHAQSAAAAPSALMMPASATGASIGPPPASAQQANPGGGFADGGPIRGGRQAPKKPNPSFQPFGTKPGATPA